MCEWARQYTWPQALTQDAHTGQHVLDAAALARSGICIARGKWGIGKAIRLCQPHNRRDHSSDDNDHYPINDYASDHASNYATDHPTYWGGNNQNDYSGSNDHNCGTRLNRGLEHDAAAV
ncbi:hypothetical protein LTR37_016697 [Vermiconidia calcicola]|uniref:Uncharacterized protein n=1 Tax=Vermiconidia calcicola TaxID=1690605 RepID=A0ACC3MN54_9PEZI|nr:hypothetical protein LTR37_016697 [Vermiconidia calcicola]